MSELLVMLNFLLAFTAWIEALVVVGCSIWLIIIGSIVLYLKYQESVR